MQDVIDELLGRSDVARSNPASQEAIRAVARRCDAPLPEALVKLWLVSDGVEMDSLDASVLGPTQVLAWLDTIPSFAERGLVPVLDDHQSNCLAVCVQGPLAFRVLHLPHDDGARVLYRDVESCVRSLVEATGLCTSADLFLSETEGDYAPEGPRTAADQTAAKALLTGADEGDAWNHATTLLDATQLDEWARLLETDHFVRRDVRARMQRMSSPDIRELLRKDDQAFEAFVSHFIASVRGAGRQVGTRDGTSLRVGNKWYELETFFHRRNVPDATERTLAWINDQLAGRDPRARSDNLMVD